ncbi:MAG TPA: uracil-DNA glycosylase family protein [Flavitalea sp.]|nr:uracil-DNA glycosylase family protein [Flavitalea sp.]
MLPSAHANTIQQQETNTNASAILTFYRQLKPDFDAGPDIVTMNPFTDTSSWELTTAFYRKYYSDENPRTLIFGINPGRFGGGVTGIPFTDPIRLESACGIPNSCKKQAELSSQFIYTMIEAYGGAGEFYNNYFITALSPLGFTKSGKNLNYYDDKYLMANIKSFICDSIEKQLKIFPSEECFCLGEGTNFKYFTRLNEETKYFKNIIALPHPRWIMQYRRKRMQEFIELFVNKLKMKNAK